VRVDERSAQAVAAVASCLSLVEGLIWCFEVIQRLGTFPEWVSIIKEEGFHE